VGVGVCVCVCVGGGEGGGGTLHSIARAHVCSLVLDPSTRERYLSRYGVNIINYNTILYESTCLA
jgi:hypothetical protein